MDIEQEHEQKLNSDDQNKEGFATVVRLSALSGKRSRARLAH